MFTNTHMLFFWFFGEYTGLCTISFSELTIYCHIESSLIYIFHQSWKPSVSAFDSFLQQSQQYILGSLYFFPLLWDPSAFCKARKVLFLQVDHYLWRLQENAVLLQGFFGLRVAGKQIQRTSVAQNGILHFNA